MKRTILPGSLRTKKYILLVLIIIIIGILFFEGVVNSKKDINPSNSNLEITTPQ